YGLFAARSRAENGFTRKTAFDNIPPTIGILRDVFRFVSFGDMPKQMESIVDDITEVLAIVDVNKILRKYYDEGKGRDPVVHFYETFLAEYDPKTREKRGVYYTPEPVVSYIVRSLHKILKDYFGREDGFATGSVRVLDPAAGTLTFLAEAAKVAAEEFENKYGEGAKKDLIHDHILNDFYAFELMMAPYAIGHLKMAFLLEELGYRLKPDERFKLYLTNTLDMEELEKSKLPGMSSLAEESHLAGTVKNETPILAILGNPPYSGHSSNKGDWIQARIQDYYQVDGKPLGEKNPKWLQDDYVKFIRFAQWKIDQAGEGVLGFITNHSYLDNPTFRGMRQSLMNSFDEMYILDLHGNSLKKEKCPDGSPDENVFDIRQGVAIALFIKKPGLKKQVAHAELYGLREQKYNWLLESDLSKTKWNTLTPHTDFYLFVPRDEELLARYETFPRITDIFPVNSVGIVTARDHFVIDFDRAELERRIRMFRDKILPDESIGSGFNLKNKPNWRLHDARESVRHDTQWDQAFVNILYRPFDARQIYYHDAVIERSRRAVMRHMLKNNLGLSLVRRPEIGQFEHVFCTEQPITHHSVSLKEVNYLFPLYLYEAEKSARRGPITTMMLFEPAAVYGARRPNLSEKVVETLTATYGRQPAPEEIFYYIYGVLYSPAYRTKYAEFLRSDFARIPLTSDVEVFQAVGKLGQRLVELHLVKSKELSSPTTKFRGSGDNLVEKPIFQSSGRIYINEAQYFDGVAEEEWKYQIGGYQVLEKWLKDRKGRRLSADDIRHYCRTATAIKRTIEIQAELGAVYSDIEKETIIFNSSRRP
ncbi:MAG: type ISP restriction/modification enzyme, partial [Actinomycetota bacterium]|nr:type ISP restriction/modification enzyme [Actinomycetota bacterium]